MKKEESELQSYLDWRDKLREEILKKKEEKANTPKVQKSIPKQDLETEENAEKSLSEKASKVLEILKEARPDRISLPNSKDKVAVQKIFGMSTSQFDRAYRELVKQGWVAWDNGPYLL